MFGLDCLNALRHREIAMIRISAVLSLLLVLLISPASSDTLSTDKPQWKVGSTYEIAPKDKEFLPCPRWNVGAPDKSFLIIRCDERAAYFSLDNNNNFTKLTDKSGAALVNFDPYVPVLEFPLEVGKSWSGFYEGTDKHSGYQWRGKTTCNVKSFEELKLPAGALKAYAIECKHDWRVGNYSGTVYSKHWYAPAAKNIVKLIVEGFSKYDFEVTSFNVE
jgi:hypothetical protein